MEIQQAELVIDQLARNAGASGSRALSHSIPETMSDTPAPSATAHQSVLIGLVLGAIGIVTSPDVTHFLPTKWALILGGLGSILAGFGITKQIQQNTQTTVAASNAVVKAITNAPPGLDPNPAIADAQRRAMANVSRVPGSPLQGS